MLEQKQLLVKNIMSDLKIAYGYYLVKTHANGKCMQTYRQSLKTKGIQLIKLKTKLLEKVLSFKKETLKDSMYLCICKEPVTILDIVELNQKHSYHTTYKLNEIIVEDVKIEPQLTGIRPSTSFKNVESLVDCKLNRGFIEINKRSLILKSSSYIKPMHLNIQKELRLNPKLVELRLVHAKLNKETYDNNYVAELNLVHNYYNGFYDYLEYLNGYSGYFNSELCHINYKLYETIKKYIPTDKTTLEKLVQYAPAKLLEVYSITTNVDPWPKQNLTSLLYLVYLGVCDSKYSSILNMFKDKSVFIDICRTHFETKHLDLQTLYADVFNKILNELTSTGINTKKSEVKKETSEIDDLF